MVASRRSFLAAGAASLLTVSRARASRPVSTFLFVADDPRVVDGVEQAAAAAKVKPRIAVAVFAGLERQGIQNGQPAVDLAQKVVASKHMSFEGWMAYSGGASHTHGWEARRQ